MLMFAAIIHVKKKLLHKHSRAIHRLHPRHLHLGDNAQLRALTAFSHKAFVYVTSPPPVPLEVPAGRDTQIRVVNKTAAARLENPAEFSHISFKYGSLKVHGRIPAIDRRDTARGYHTQVLTVVPLEY